MTRAPALIQTENDLTEGNAVSFPYGKSPSLIYSTRISRLEQIP